MPLIRPPPTAPQASTSSPSLENKTAPPFAPCTRSQFTAGKNDWLQITSPHPFPNIDICPDCFNTSIKNTYYAQFIKPAAEKPEDVSTRCDLSIIWMKIAYAWLYTHNYPDLSLLGTLSELQDPEGACPNLDSESVEVKKGGKASSTRTWYCLHDPRTDSLVDEMTICSNCVTILTTITPQLRGVFAAAEGGQKVLATCDLMVPSQDRTAQYIDQFLGVAENVIKDGHRDVTPAIEYIKKWAPIPYCPKFNNVSGQKCWSLSHVVPEWTICEQCYITHVAPLYHKSPQPLVLSQVSALPQAPQGKFHCQLYSPRLQQYWQDACTTNDLAGLQHKIRERDQKMVEVKQKLEHMAMQYEQQKMQAQYHFQMMNIEQANAMTASMSWSVGGYYGVPADFRGANAQMSQAGQLYLQANMILDNYRMLEKEWADYWE
ncbi:hypothetical protein CC78DRAFT_540950 [Lojkania enalia]|uniref:Uncharacterized protein n=1 Tax=Lojkania enalia TaxID=147567 RepID=A0A9P4N3A1_9PLEO|nr:hypothetical protein CC78DRAFT_540950 [Didymosphaeria enalia]